MWPGRPHTRGAGGPLGGIVAVEQYRQWPLVADIPVKLKLQGQYGWMLLLNAESISRFEF